MTAKIAIVLASFVLFAVVVSEARQEFKSAVLLKLSKEAEHVW